MRVYVVWSATHIMACFYKLHLSAFKGHHLGAEDLAFTAMAFRTLESLGHLDSMAPSIKA